MPAVHCTPLNAHRERIVVKQQSIGVNLLHLAHSRAAADATGAGVSTTTGRETADNGGGEESGECEPEERGRSLAFTAARGGATGDDVGVEVALKWIVSQRFSIHEKSMLLTRLLQLWTRR